MMGDGTTTYRVRRSGGGTFARITIATGLARFRIAIVWALTVFTGLCDCTYPTVDRVSRWPTIYSRNQWLSTVVVSDVVSVWIQEVVVDDLVPLRPEIAEAGSDMDIAIRGQRERLNKLGERIETRRRELRRKAQIISLAPDVVNLCFTLPI